MLSKASCQHIHETKCSTFRYESIKRNSFWTGCILNLYEILNQTLTSPPLRLHLGQHSPAGVNRLWSAGQLIGGQRAALQDTDPLEQTHTVQGEGLHWLSCYGNQRDKELHRNITSGGGRGRREWWETQRDEESCCVVHGRENFFYLRLRDRQENRVTEGGEGRGKMCQSANTGMRDEGKNRLKNEGVCEYNLNMQWEKWTADLSVYNKSFHHSLPFKDFNSTARPAWGEGSACCWRTSRALVSFSVTKCFRPTYACTKPLQCFMSMTDWTGRMESTLTQPRHPYLVHICSWIY